MLYTQRHHLKKIHRQLSARIKNPHTITVLFDHFGVVCSDPLAKWKYDHELDNQQLQHMQTLCNQIDSGKLELWPFYTELGGITGQSPEQVKHELDHNGVYNWELLDIIRQLRAVPNVRVGLLSNAHRSLHLSLWHDGVHQYFDDVLTSQEVSKVKPKPDADFFYHAINRLGGTPARTIFFDDRPVNVDGARAAGLKAHLFTSAARCKLDLHRHRIFDD